MATNFIFLISKNINLQRNIKFVMQRVLANYKNRMHSKSNPWTKSCEILIRSTFLLLSYNHTQKNMGLGLGFVFGNSPKTHTHTQNPKKFRFIPKNPKFLGLYPKPKPKFFVNFFNSFDQKIWVFTQIQIFLGFLGLGFGYKPK